MQNERRRRQTDALTGMAERVGMSSAIWKGVSNIILLSSLIIWQHDEIFSN